MKSIISALVIALGYGVAEAAFNGLNMSMGNLATISDAQSRSISPENFTGAAGSGGMASPGQLTNNVNNASHAARDLGRGWKVNPYVYIAAKQTFTLADITGPGAIQHIWMTTGGAWRWAILRIYWDDEPTPSVEVPLGDFFCQGWGVYAPVNSAAVCVNPGKAFNCYWTMPFRRRCRMTIENMDDENAMKLYYSIDYTLTEVSADQAYFHAQFRRTHYNESSNWTILDGVEGRGHFVGVYLALGVRNNGCWCEGEAKFYLDDDREYPTICGTGLEDYFCGSYAFVVGGKYLEYCTPYAGVCQVIRPDGTYKSQERFGLYRWHIMDPIRFRKRFKMTLQDLGWRAGGRYLKQHSDIASTAFWYQIEPHAAFPKFPSREDLEPL